MSGTSYWIDFCSSHTRVWLIGADCGVRCHTPLIRPFTCLVPRTLFLLPSNLSPSRPLTKPFSLVLQIEDLRVLLKALPAGSISCNHHLSGPPWVRLKSGSIPFRAFTSMLWFIHDFFSVFYQLSLGDFIWGVDQRETVVSNRQVTWGPGLLTLAPRAGSCCK